MDDENREEKPIEFDEKYKIRKLTRKDRVQLSGIISSFAHVVSDSKILDIMKSVDKKTDDSQEPIDNEVEDGKNIIAVGIKIIAECMGVVEDDVSDWFVSLLNTDTEKFKEYPLNIDLIVIQQLKDDPEFTSFFVQASRLFKGTLMLKGMFSNAKKRFNIASK